MVQDFTDSFPTLPSLSLSLSLSLSHIRRCLFPCACDVSLLLTASLFSQYLWRCVYDLCVFVIFVSHFCAFLWVCEPFWSILMVAWHFFLTFFFCILKCTCMSCCAFYAVVCAFFVRLCILLCVCVYVCICMYFLCFCGPFFVCFCILMCTYILLYNFMLVCVFVSLHVYVGHYIYM